MYSKVYWIGCDPDKAPNLMEHYDSVLTPAIQSSEYHVGWLLVSNYHDKAGADAAVPMVQELVKPMVEQYGMTLEVITEGKVARSI
jgi:hypothetical protein